MDIFARGPRSIYWAFSALSVLAIFTTALANPIPESDVARTAYARMLELRDQGQPILRYPLGVNPLEKPKAHLRFGFESEYVLDEAGGLLKVYMPDSEFGISPDQWFTKMSEEERMAWLKHHLKQVFPSKRLPGKLVKHTSDPAFAFLPERLIMDTTNNLEIIVGPADTLEEWKRRVTLINENLGVGSMQTTVGAPSEAFFDPRHTNPEETIGFLSFMSEMDTLQKLESGAARFAKDPTKETALSFKHPFLGPLTRIKQLKMKEFVLANSQGKLLEPQDLERISLMDSSFKYIGGTAYRPDIVPYVAVILEVRDAHKSFPNLLDRVLRATFHLQYGKQVFRSASQINVFDSVNDFEKFPSHIQSMLKTLFPARTIPGEDYDEEEVISLEIFRNFSFPLKDWSPTLQALQAEDLSPRIRKAQRQYVLALEKTADALAAGEITAEKASVQVQGALTQFAPESGILDAYRKWQNKHLLASPEWNRYLNVAIREVGPMTEAYSSDIWEGSLEARLTRLASQWPANIEIQQSNRLFVQIDGAGLSEAEQKALMQDYLNAVARLTLSFPTDVQGNAYVRLGNQVYSAQGARVTDLSRFLPASTPRTEALLTLSPKEELRIRHAFSPRKKGKTCEDTLARSNPISEVNPSAVQALISKHAPSQTDQTQAAAHPVVVQWKN